MRAIPLLFSFGLVAPLGGVYLLLKVQRGAFAAALTLACPLVFGEVPALTQASPPGDSKIHAALTSERTSWSSGESIAVTLVISNRTEDPFTFPDSRPTSGVVIQIADLTRKQRLLSDRERSSTLAPDEATRQGFLVGEVFSAGIHPIPARGKYTRQFDLTREYDLTQDGDYVVTFSLRVRDENEQWIPLTTAPLFFTVSKRADGTVAERNEAGWLKKIASRTEAKLDPGWIRKLSNRTDAAAAKTQANLPPGSQASSSAKSEPATGPNSQTLATALGWRMPALLVAAVGLIGYILLRARRRAGQAERRPVIEHSTRL